jgi:hypothetical protein
MCFDWGIYCFLGSNDLFTGVAAFAGGVAIAGDADFSEWLLLSDSLPCVGITGAGTLSCLDLSVLVASAPLMSDGFLPPEIPFIFAALVLLRVGAVCGW